MVRLELNDFRCFHHAVIDLGPMTVLIGPNGSGKTSILSALELVQSEGGHGSSSTSFVRKGSAPVETWVKIGTTDSHCMLEVVLGMWARSGGGWGDIGVDLQGEVLQLEATCLARPCPTHIQVAKLQRDGSGLATVIAHLILGAPERFQRITSSLTSIVPKFVGLRVEIDQSLGTTSYALVFDMVGAKGVAASAMSEGTLVALGILAAIHGPQQPDKLILLDEVGRGLHPRAVGSLIQALRAVLKDHPDLHIVATTHSPFVVDEMEPHEVWATRLDDTGTAHVACLATHPRIDSLKEMLRTGEIWSVVGEDWTHE